MLLLLFIFLGISHLVHPVHKPYTMIAAPYLHGRNALKPGAPVRVIPFRLLISASGTPGLISSSCLQGSAMDRSCTPWNMQWEVVFIISPVSQFLAAAFFCTSSRNARQLYQYLVCLFHQYILLPLSRKYFPAACICILLSI